MGWRIKFTNVALSVGISDQAPALWFRHVLTEESLVDNVTGCRDALGLPNANLCRGGELVDALASGASGGNPVEVQVLSSAPFLIRFW